MTKPIEEKLEKIPIIKNLVKFLKGVKLPGFEGLSTYDLMELYVIGIVQGAVTTRASAIAFNFFTAIFPFLLFVIILIPIIPIENFQQEFLEFLDSILPPQTFDFFSENIFDNISRDSSGSLLSTVFILSIILMANGVSAIFSGFESSYHEQLSRSIFKQYLYALGVALILAFLVILTVAIFGYFQIYIIQPLYNSFTGESFSETGSALNWIVVGKYLFFIVMTYIATATLYYFGTKEGRNNRFFSIGAALTTFLIMVTSYLFGVYIDNFSKYNELYGSIGALLILLFYLWLNSNILLLGYELNASLNRLRKFNQ